MSSGICRLFCLGLDVLKNGTRTQYVIESCSTMQGNVIISFHISKWKINIIYKYLNHPCAHPKWVEQIWKLIRYRYRVVSVIVIGMVSQRTHDAMITSLLRYIDVNSTPCVRWNVPFSFWLTWVTDVSGSMEASLVSCCAKHLPEALQLLWKTSGKLITDTEDLSTTPKHLLTAPEHFRNCKYFGAVSKCSGAVTKVFRSSYESVPGQLLSLPEHL